jgi:hypothetical protein
MDKRLALPMMALCLLLTGCGGGEEAADLRRPYQEMTGCSMEAVVTCGQEDLIWEGTLRCGYVPGGESTVEVLAPETIAGVRAVLTDSDWYLEYEDMSLNAGTLSREAVSPAACLPRLMDALRDGWLLEENRETWGETPCVRLAVDQTGGQGGKLVSTLWLREEDGLPLWGELAVDGEIILTAEFTSFSFCDTLN